MRSFSGFRWSASPVWASVNFKACKGCLAGPWPGFCQPERALERRPLTFGLPRPGHGEQKRQALVRARSWQIQKLPPQVSGYQQTVRAVRVVTPKQAR
jgi:hypothetical protein